jgi:hypothetical protein
MDDLLHKSVLSVPLANPHYHLWPAAEARLVTLLDLPVGPEDRLLLLSILFQEVDNLLLGTLFQVINLHLVGHQTNQLEANLLSGTLFQVNNLHLVGHQPNQLADNLMLGTLFPINSLLM